MSDESVFTVPSARGGVRLEFRGSVPRGGAAYEGFTMHVRLSGGAVEASERVYDHLAHRWADLFAGMARDWRGWEAERRVASLEGQLEISCRIDRLGHVALRVELNGDRSGGGWLAADTIALESGQLDDLARRAREFFGGSPDLPR